jgi:16S rRNA (guanine527-N7)-methyltransferase
MSETHPTLPNRPEDWQALGWQPNENQQSQFQRFYEYLLEGNQQFNLTRITEPAEFWEKHLWDSLRGVAVFLHQPNQAAIASHHPAPDPTPISPSSIIPALPATPEILDIGTGAGFPGIPVAIALPHSHVTLLDSTQKKITFLETTLKAVGIENCRTICDRAEQAGQHPSHRGHYDLVLVRAVAPATVCAEYALPLLKVGGIAVLYRGHWSDFEQTALETALQQLQGQVLTIEAFNTPLTAAVRHCIYVQKTQATPKDFPRPVGTPTRQPLGSTL